MLVIRQLRRVLRFGDHAAIWRTLQPRRALPRASWFANRFVAASSQIVRRWGPAWASKWSFLGIEIGAWLLGFIWFGAPLAMVLRSTWHLLH